MLYSMTGYGKARKEFQNRAVSVELKSLNGKEFYLKMRLPLQYQPREISIRRMLHTAIIRGKVDLRLNITSNVDTEYSIDTTTFEHYYDKLSQLASEKGFEPSNILYAITRMPNVIVSNKDKTSEESWQEVLSVLEEALVNFNDFRMKEGEALATDIEMRVKLIQHLLEKMKPYEAERIEKLRERIYTNLEQAKLRGRIDENRFEQELVYYLDRLNITEEKVRLKQHCSYFLEVMKAKSKTKGKKLSFILQEMGREINTIGSKANFVDLQRIVIQMKDEAEKVKEQLANIM